MSCGISFALVLPSNLIIIVYEDRPSQIVLKKCIKPVFYNNAQPAQRFSRHQLPLTDIWTNQNSAENDDSSFMSENTEGTKKKNS